MTRALAWIAATAAVVVAAVGCDSGTDHAGASSTVAATETRVDTIIYCVSSEPCLREGWYPVSGPSMEPTLHCTGSPECGRRFNRNRVKTAEMIEPPRRFDLVVSYNPAYDICSFDGPLRVIGLPGEVWEERQGVVYINGKMLVEPYIHPERRDRRTFSMRDIRPRGTLRRIPPKKYLLMGDNRVDACDSRSTGLVEFRTNWMTKVVLIANFMGDPIGLPPRGYYCSPRSAGADVRGERGVVAPMPCD